MKIWFFSDIHMPNDALDADRIFPAIPDADLCICAGDLIEGDPAAAVEWLDFYIGPHMPTLYVMGNHEFYTRERSMQRNRELAGRAAARTAGRVNVLDDMSYTIGGHRLLGTTLWYDLKLNGSDKVSMAYAEQGAWRLNDSRIIRRDDRSTKIWTPQDARQQHIRSKRWLEAELAASELPTIVVSHHAPHPRSIATRFKNDESTPAFVSDMSRLIEQYRPAMWLHGHVHDSFDYTVADTRIVCNPKGYGRENAAAWNPSFVIDTDEFIPKPPGM